MLGIVVQIEQRAVPWSLSSVLESFAGEPLLWIIGSAPVVLGMVAAISVRLQIERAADEGRRARIFAQRLYTAVDGLAAGVLIESAGRRILFANAELCSIFGTSLAPDELVDADCDAACERASTLLVDSDAFVARTRALVAERQKVTGERWSCRDGRILERDYVPVFFEESYHGHVWTYRDVTQRERLFAAEREARSRLDFLIRSLSYGVFLADAEGRIFEWSPGAEQLLDYRAAEVIGHPIRDVVAEHQRSEFEAALRPLLSGASVAAPPIALQGQRRDGRGVSLDVSLAAWETPSGRIVGAVLKDLSKQVVAERRLAELEKNWRDIAQSSSDALFLLDAAGTVVFANRAFGGKSLEQLIGGDIRSVLPRSAAWLDAGLRAAFERGVPSESEGLSDAGGGQGWSWLRLAPQSEDGEVARAALSISDTSARRASDLAAKRIAAIVETTSDAVITSDASGRITSWNRGAESLLGWARAEALGRHFEFLLPERERDRIGKLWAELQRGESIQAESIACVAKGGQLVTLAGVLSPTPSESGVFEGASAIVRDVTHEREVKATLERAKSEAETASRTKSEFLANMSHEVRTPLNGIVGVVDLLRSTALSDEQRALVDTLLDASHSLRTIVDDLLDFSKIEAGRLTLEAMRFDVMAVIASCTEMFRSLAEKNGTRIEVPPSKRGMPVVGDPTRFRQVLNNLVSNAVKFTKAGTVAVRTSQFQVSTDTWRVRVEVEDSGVGIPPDARDRLFRPFTQADGSVTRQFGGTGLGLSICRRLVGLMGGSIDFTSEMGRGTTFWFEVLLGVAAPDGAELVPAVVSGLPEQARESRRVLVAEDNAINQRVVSIMLQRMGLGVDIAADGSAAVELWKRGGHDLILMDCQMPVMSGFEAAESIRKLEGARRTPIVAMTAQAYAEDRARCIAAGMDDHMAKPITRDELEKVLAKWLVAPHPAHPQRTAMAVDDSIDRASIDRLASELGEGGAEILTELARGFVAEFPGALEQLGSNASAGAWESVAFEAHRLRSSTSNLGAAALSQSCRELELSAKKHDAVTAASILRAMREEFPRTSRALLEHVEKKTRRPTSLRSPKAGTA